MTFITINNDSNNTSHMHTTPSMLSMLQQVQAQYRKVQKKTDCETLLVTIPTAFAQAIPLQKSDVVKITLEGKTVRLEKV